MEDGYKEYIGLEEVLQILDVAMVQAKGLDYPEGVGAKLAIRIIDNIGLRVKTLKRKIISEGEMKK